MLNFAGALLSGVSSLSAARAQKRQAEKNAIYREFQAKDAIIQGQKQSAQVSARARQGKAQLSAAAAAQGIQGGTVDTLENQFDYLSAEDISVIENSAMREAFNLKNDAKNQIEQARLNSRAALFGAGTSVLTAGAKFVAKEKIKDLNKKKET